MTALIAILLAVQQRSVQQQSQQTGQHQTTIMNGTNAAQLHKLLVSGTTTNGSPVTTSTITSVMPAMGPELARLPGGNLMPGTNGSALYRGNGKLAIVNNGITIKGMSPDDAPPPGSCSKSVPIPQEPIRINQIVQCTW